MAHFLRPVPRSFCAANPPGSLDFTYFSMLIVSRSGGAAAAAEATMAGGGVLKTMALWEDLLGASVSVLGLEEICEEKERAAKEEVRDEREIAIGV